ncbi:hypothetical protein ACHAXA_006654 [Cyclostephanos tholiformis]|uniref:Uncharacterized protein n=1 Tax=Cyclostephanos tholiformis TaxID=382380 RepID=A0ABD3REH9_9STRA
MFCWGCGISELYNPIVDFIDFIDGDGAYCRCNTISPTGSDDLLHEGALQSNLGCCPCERSIELLAISFESIMRLGRN